jgi:hypothetical protein
VLYFQVQLFAFLTQSYRSLYRKRAAKPTRFASGPHRFEALKSEGIFRKENSLKKNGAKAPFSRDVSASTFCSLATLFAVAQAWQNAIDFLDAFQHAFALVVIQRSGKGFQNVPVVWQQFVEHFAAFFGQL